LEHLYVIKTNLVGKGALAVLKTIRSKKVIFKTGKMGKYYKGGFDHNMSRREAALILAVKESSTKKELREAHRRLMMLNHPDSGKI
jgi:DnaJ family protein C protein 19